MYACAHTHLRSGSQIARSLRYMCETVMRLTPYQLGNRFEGRLGDVQTDRILWARCDGFSYDSIFRVNRLESLDTVKLLILLEVR